MRPKNIQPEAVNKFLERFHRPLLLVLALAVLICGYFIALANPIRIYQENYSLLAGLNGDIDLAKANLETTKSFSGKIFQPTALESKLLDMALPLAFDDASLITQIYSIAAKSGLSVSSIDLERTNGTSPGKISSNAIGKISIRLKLNGGGYDELKQFLKLLESSLLMIDVYSVNFTAKSPTYDLTLTAYYYNNQPAAK